MVTAAPDSTVVPPLPRALVVDDDVTLLDLQIRALGRAGFVVEGVSTAEAAVEAFRKQPHDLVITDLLLPGMDGIELLRHLRTLDLDVPVVIVTGAPTLASAIHAVELGAMQYLTKPVDTDNMVLVARKALYVGQLARLKREALAAIDPGHRGVTDKAGLEVCFQRALPQI